MFSFHDLSHGTFVSACYICCGHFWTRSEPFLGHKDNVIIDACGKSKVFSPVNPFLFKCTRAHTCGRAVSRALSHKSTYTLNLISVFPGG